jgi:hypothetical protein
VQGFLTIPKHSHKTFSSKEPMSSHLRRVLLPDRKVLGNHEYGSSSFLARTREGGSLDLQVVKPAVQQYGSAAVLTQVSQQGQA